MKITKEALAKLREDLRSPYMSDVDDAVVLALLDERKALREALRACLPIGPKSAEQRELALLGGEDE